jgi:hypothetical protein
MTIPSLLFAILISTFYGVAFHVWRGGSAGRLILYVILGWTLDRRIFWLVASQLWPHKFRNCDHIQLFIPDRRLLARSSTSRT